MKILVTEKQIETRVIEIAKQISIDYTDKPLTIIVILNGAILFAADLIKRISIPIQIDSFAISSYVNDKSSDNITVRSNLKLPINNRHILLVDDILDTGKSLQYLTNYFTKFNPLSIKTCVLLNKNIENKCIATADYTCFYIPNKYVVGYGLDSNEYYRNLPYIGVIE